MARLIDRRDTAEVSVVVRHRCPTFTFGSALGPRDLESYWWAADGGDINAVGATGATRDEFALISAAIAVALSGRVDYRRHLDELAELPS